MHHLAYVLPPRLPEHRFKFLDAPGQLPDVRALVTRHDGAVSAHPAEIGVRVPFPTELDTRRRHVRNFDLHCGTTGAITVVVVGSFTSNRYHPC